MNEVAIKVAVAMAMALSSSDDPTCPCGSNCDCGCAETGVCSCTSAAPLTRVSYSTAKSCPCSLECTCGCNEGNRCTCADVTYKPTRVTYTPAPVYNFTPQYRPVYYPARQSYTVPFYQRPAFSAPVFRGRGGNC